MDYETADGSQVSLREEFSSDGGEARFKRTLITAFVDGNAYAGTTTHRMEEMDDFDVLQYLEPVPSENVFPPLPQHLTIAPPFDEANHYLKAPQFTHDDVRPGRTFVADTLLGEATVLEQLRQFPHSSIATYYGAVVRDGRITHLCLKKYNGNLTNYDLESFTQMEKARLLEQVRNGIEYLHELGLAHNDIKPDNICIDANGNAVIIDFDSCLPFGRPLMKGEADLKVATSDHLVSTRENDSRGLSNIERLLFPEE